MIEKQPFRKYDLDDNKQDVVAVKFNIEERNKLNEIKRLFQNDKDSTTLKQCLDITEKVLLDQKLRICLHHIINNYRRNIRTGIVSYNDTTYIKE